MSVLLVLVCLHAAKKRLQRIYKWFQLSRPACCHIAEGANAGTKGREHPDCLQGDVEEAVELVLWVLECELFSHG